jgi:hypothetical protein
MTFTLNAEVAAVLAAAIERSGPPPAPPVGDVASRRVALEAMLGYFNNQAQPVASKVDISDHSVVTSDGATLLARWYRLPSSESKAAVLYLHGGGMIVGSVPIFDGPVSRYVTRTGVSMLSLEYRLAPEHPHPTPVEDAYAGLVWLYLPVPQPRPLRRIQRHRPGRGLLRQPQDLPAIPAREPAHEPRHPYGRDHPDPPRPQRRPRLRRPENSSGKIP